MNKGLQGKVCGEKKGSCDCGLGPVLEQGMGPGVWQSPTAVGVGEGDPAQPMLCWEKSLLRGKGRKFRVEIRIWGYWC